MAKRNTVKLALRIAALFIIVEAFFKLIPLLNFAVSIFSILLLPGVESESSRNTLFIIKGAFGCAFYLGFGLFFWFKAEFLSDKIFLGGLGNSEVSGSRFQDLREGAGLFFFVEGIPFLLGKVFAFLLFFNQYISISALVRPEGVLLEFIIKNIFPRVVQVGLGLGLFLGSHRIIEWIKKR